MPPHDSFYASRRGEDGDDTRDTHDDHGDHDDIDDSDEHNVIPVKVTMINFQYATP